MSIHLDEDVETRWPILVYEDSSAVKEIEQSLSELLARRNTTPVRLLIDVRNCTDFPPVTQMLRPVIAVADRDYTRLTGAQIAIVVCDRQQAGKAELADRVIQLPFSVRAFRDWTEAERWLEGQPPTDLN